MLNGSPLSESHGAFFYQKNGTIQSGNPLIFEEFTGAKWCNATRFEPELTHNEMFKFHPTEVEKQLMRFLIPLYRHYKKKPPKLYVRLGKCKGTHSVHALEKIEKGQIVTEYIGEWKPNATETSSYRFGPIDAKHYRNCSALIEDGFPNLATFHLYHTDGIPLRIIFVALKEIAAGEMVTINYGLNHSVKSSYHTEYQFEEASSFFRRNSINKLLKRIVELRQNLPQELGWRRSLELEGLVARLRYLYHTPGTLIKLIAHEVISNEEVWKCYEKPDQRYYLLNFAPLPTQRQLLISSCLSWIQRFFASGLNTSSLNLELLDKMPHQLYFSSYISSLLEEHTPLRPTG